MATKTHEILIHARITKANPGDAFALHTLHLESFVVDGVDIVEADITAPHQTALAAAMKDAVQDHTGEV